MSSFNSPDLHSMSTDKMAIPLGWNSNTDGIESPQSEQLTEATGISTAFSGLSEDRTMPIAVVGMSFRGPADATSVESLWKMISEGREGWSKIPKERWNNDAFYHPDHSRHGTVRLTSEVSQHDHD